MRSIKRLPVAPRPFRDELLSSWLARIACRYGLEMRDLIGYWGDERWVEAIDADGPTTHQTKIWAQACGVDPVRLHHLSLARRRPKRLNQWFLDRTWQSMPICLACIDADFVERVLGLQKKIGRIVTKSTERRERLETLIATPLITRQRPARFLPFGLINQDGAALFKLGMP